MRNTKIPDGLMVLVRIWGDSRDDINAHLMVDGWLKMNLGSMGRCFLSSKRLVDTTTAHEMYF